LVGVNVVSTLPKHAYNVHPYNKTLRTKAFTNNNLTLTFVIPIIRQLVHTELKLLLAAFSLAINISSGYTLLLFNIIPKYLNSSTISISEFPIYIYPKQFTNIAFVFPILILSKFILQKASRRCNSAYNSIGEGASKTRSSA
jgi:hypothetical protein